jgi:hypothetical protein
MKPIISILTLSLMIPLSSAQSIADDGDDSSYSSALFGVGSNSDSGSDDSGSISSASPESASTYGPASPPTYDPPAPEATTPMPTYQPLNTLPQGPPQSPFARLTQAQIRAYFRLNSCQGMGCQGNPGAPFVYDAPGAGSLGGSTQVEGVQTSDPGQTGEQIKIVACESRVVDHQPAQGIEDAFISGTITTCTLTGGGSCDITDQVFDSPDQFNPGARLSDPHKSDDCAQYLGTNG